MNRTVVDAYDIQDNVPIYFNGHALLTMTSDGSNIEEKLKNIANIIPSINIGAETTDLVVINNIELLTWEALNANIDLDELNSLL